MEQTIQLTIEQGARIAKETNQGMSDVDFSISTVAFNLGIEEILGEIALHHISQLELDQIEAESIYYEAWNELEKQNEQLYLQLIQNSNEAAIKSYIQGFVDGYKLLKSINEKKGICLIGEKFNNLKFQ